MTITNKYPGQCLTCRARVTAGAGVAVMVDGRWSTYCATHAPGKVAKPATNVGDASIELTINASGKVSIRPAGYLGGDLFEAYRNACGGSNFDRETRANIAAIDMVGGIVTRLTRAGFQIKAEPQVTAMVQAWEARTQADSSAASERTIEVAMRLAARGLALFPFQSEGVAWLAPRTGALLGDDMGLGKTIQALTALPTGASVLVICPAVAKGVWVRECNRWRPDITPTVLDGRNSFRWPRAGEMVITNYAILPPTPEEYEAAISDKDGTVEPREARELIPAPNVVVIADEAHVIKGSKTKTRLRFDALANVAYEASGRIWLLTATPLLNRPTELWSMLRACKMEKVVFGSWPNFKRLMGGQSNGYGTTYDAEGIDSAAVAPKLREAMLRRLKRDVLSQLPAKTVEVLDVEISDAAIERLDAMQAELEANGIDLATALRLARENNTIAFEIIAKARALLATAKAAYAMELADELDESDEPAIVFSAHREPIRIFEKRKGWAVITGDTKPAERTKIEERFQRGELKGVAGTIKAMGVAITLTRSANVIVIDPEWTPALNEQAEDRAYRIGQARPVTITYLRAAHAIDARMFEVLEIKRAIIARTTDAAAVQVGNAPALASAYDALVYAMAPESRADRERVARELAERVRAEREAFERDRDRHLATIKSERANVNRGWRINPALFQTPVRAPRTAPEVWAMGALAMLAELDPDRAKARNMVGFNASDGTLGHALASAAAAGALNDGEWAVAISLARHYPRQVGECPNV